MSNVKLTQFFHRKSLCILVVMSLENVKSPNCFVLGEHVLWLDRRWSVELSGSGRCFKSKDVLFKETLLDELRSRWSYVPCSHGRSNILLFWKVRDHTGLV